MTYTETLRQGAAVVRRTSPKNIMELLIGIIESDPTADTDRLFRLWSEAVKEDDDYLSAALRHTFTNLHHAIETGRKPRQRGQRSATEQRTAINAIKAQVRQAIILDFVMPNGKKLRDCRVDYVKRCNAGFDRLLTGLKPNDIVGKKLTDKQAQAKWEQGPIK
jgi:hypothetical protein